jgi:hypothetical protein
MATNKVLDVVKFVRSYIAENDRGCPKGVLQHVGGFKAKDIALALETGLLESGRGSEGGLFPKGERPAPKDRVAVTLKSRLVDALRVIATGGTLDRDFAATLVAEYDAEIEKRRDAQA